jgi:ATP-dependent DNA helicase RecG
VEETMMYILSHIKVAFEFTGAIQRKEVFEYPLNALREIVLNAVVHRDYTSPIDTQIKIFDDKITFFNPGRLYGDITVEKLATDSYQAQTRNKLIAEAFYLTGDIEKYGSGYIRIRNEITAYPGMKFDFEEMGNGYLVTLSYGTGEGVSEGVGEGVSEGVSEGAQNLLHLITELPGLRTTQLSEMLDVPIKTLERWLKALREDKKIEFRGAPKTGGYYPKEKK